MKGQVEANAQVQGTIHPFVLTTQGTVQTGPLTLSGAEIDSLRMKWKGDERRIQVPTLEARLYDGRITGSAVLPVSSSEAGSASLRLDDIRLRKIAERMGGLPFRVEGILSGTAEATISAAGKDQPRRVSAQLEVDSPQLRVQGIPATNVRGTLGYKSGKADYRLEGNSLGGRFTLRGKTPIPLPTEPQGPEVPGEPAPRKEAVAPGRLDVRGVRLSRLWPYLGLEERLGPLTGGFSLSLPFDLGPGGRPTGTGRFELTGLRWGGEELAGTILGNVVLRRQVLLLRNLSGDLGQGSFRGEVSLRLARVLTGWLHLSLEQVDLRRLLVLFPDIRNDVQGAVDADIRGQIGPEWRGTATVALAHARVFGLEVTQWRIPLGFGWVPAEGGGEVNVSESSAEIAHGRANLQAYLTWGAGINLRGLLRFSEVDLATFLRSFGSIGSYAAGRVSGRIDFSGNQMHSVNDLQANVVARLRETQALELPVLRVLTPYIRPGVSATAFQSGALKGRLGGGIFRVESLTLASEILELVLVGTVTLTGRLNLDVSTRSGLQIRNTEKLQALGLRVRSLSTLPLAVLAEAATLLANRVVHLRLTGTLRSPVIQVLPGTLLPEEAIRFFLTGAADVSVP
jgi:hypothetical protein